MITLEKDNNAEEIVIHASASDLREFAKKLWQLSEKADTKGKHKEQFSSHGFEPELSNQLVGDAKKYKVVKKLTVSSVAD